MAFIRRKLVYDAVIKAYALTDDKVYDDITKRYEFRKKIIHDDESLSKDEKEWVAKMMAKDYNRNKIRFNKGTKRPCNNCFLECLATLYCEHCIRAYLKNNFSNWTSGNNDIDDLIQKCQMETFSPNKIIEYIPYNNLQDIKYIARGGCSEIYSANWTNGPYREWDSKEKQLKRLRSRKVILKTLENVESANRSWLEEVQHIYFKVI
jgi:hypothetical protein